MNKQNLKNKTVALKKILIQNRRNAVILGAGFLLLILLILFFITLTQQKRTKQLKIKYVLENQLIEPAEPTSENTYSVDRVTPDKWTSEECNNLFTVPKGDVFTQIQLSNDQMIKTILKDAP